MQMTPGTHRAGTRDTRKRNTALRHMWVLALGIDPDYSGRNINVAPFGSLLAMLCKNIEVSWGFWVCTLSAKYLPFFPKYQEKD